MKKPTLEERLQERILILDGAMGTMIQQADLSPEDFGGEHLDGCNEMLVLTRPDVISRIHEQYLEAGADILETNTFGATSIVLAEYDLQEQARELNLAAAKLAVEAAKKFSTPDWPRYVAGAMGPTTKTLSVTGGVTFDQLVDTYYEQALALIEAGVDALLLETSQDTLNVKAGSIAIQRAMETTGQKLPLMISGTIEPMGTTLAGQNIESFYISLEHLNPVSIGLNCATGPEFMRDHLRSLSAISRAAISCYPNAGLPDENGHYHESPESLARKIATFAEQGWLNIAGGCCGTTPEHIRVLKEELDKYEPRQQAGSHPPAVSGIETVYIENESRPYMVGERTNVLGSRKFKRLIREGKIEEAAEVARAQVKSGAHVIDVCLQDPDRDETEDMRVFLQEVVKKVKVPLVIDTTDPEVLELALKYTQGKAIINSVNLEDGLEKFENVVPLVHRYGASLVVGTIDERGQAITREDKLEVAQRSYDILVNDFGIEPENIIFDPLVFPVGTGDEQYIGSAKETIEGIRLIKEAMPRCQSILGVSNISFGLPEAGREVLNSVFLYECTKAGLDYAIVNTEKLERYASIPEHERKLSEALLYETNDETLAEFVAAFRNRAVEKKVKTNDLPLEERLASYIVEGTKEGLTPDLALALDKYPPLDIINGPLMKGMEEVGRLFNNNELIVAEVLQSAEVMKASVAFLEPHMEKNESAVKGKILLATVKGDVHDIGKNLVEIILSNNGYEIINLGIKVPPEQLIEAYRKEKPDAIGLSGLLVKSAQQMVVTAQDLRSAGIDVPIMVGGAALTRKFTKNRIIPEYDGLVLYAKDAMEGLDLANKLMNAEERQLLVDELRAHKERLAKEEEGEQKLPKLTRAVRSAIKEAPVQLPPDLERHVLRNIPVPQVIPYVNMQMLLGHHLGMRGSVEQRLKERDPKTVELKETVDRILREEAESGVLQANAMYRFFPAQSEGDSIHIYNPERQDEVLHTFTFPRQQVDPYMCLADFLRSKESGVMDYVGFLVVTAGKGVRERSDEFKHQGEYLRSHALQSVALELAEGLAERIHHMMREVWGIPDPAEMTMKERFGARYQGIRVSFGYPACPNLEDQEPLFRLMQPEDIGVHLTEGFMMEPEASVTAMVFAHPQGTYFNVDKA
ncbi:methionine synthase [Paenibacillus thiaminolyticus]|uniref:Methionine synthase n=1 Tax=Paenibacillus thiaminolyticus TaxID=49283 RepID=A0AAP9J0A3_PANTH|nr:methionine synthase [Paenibacillus thiaminolyticus]MCY9536088.1 methionine synthase [Paenibacillus thiaminolyticus]MCY9602251.1 methionine synthase [Paenibacillus thiaminolyticus]MCY9608646.1 methionine synthase [Paenibacillus thiaminolyticus]MCY9613392.1 methionine synthase [Paenibacillus thiaminolyticus]MCY9620211.1 methionine synthase [Paenibacillus thiaminolyticus]